SLPHQNVAKYALYEVLLVWISFYYTIRLCLSRLLFLPQIRRIQSRRVPIYPLPKMLAFRKRICLQRYTSIIHLNFSNCPCVLAVVLDILDADSLDPAVPPKWLKFCPRLVSNPALVQRTSSSCLNMLMQKIAS